jgi:hypothetical protein
LEKLSLTIDNELAILEKYQISPNEWFLIKLLFIANEEYFPEYIFRFLAIPTEMRGDVRESLVSLQEKGIILKSYKIPAKGEKFIPENVEFNKAFLNTCFRSSYELGEELWQAYPDNVIIGGVTYSLKNVAKKYNGIEEFFSAYGKAIRYKQEKHQHILELLKWAIDNTNFINFSIVEFVMSRKWEEIERLKNGDSGTINYDAIRSL